MKIKIYSYILVLIQFGSIGLIILSGKFVPDSLWSWSIMIMGVLLGLLAIYSMKASNLSIVPDVKNDAIFIKRGPYKYIRHPMYTALILIVIPIISEFPSTFRWIIGAIFITNMVLKMNYEEKLLLKKFKEYELYKFTTCRIFPCVY